MKRQGYEYIIDKTWKYTLFVNKMLLSPGTYQLGFFRIKSSQEIRVK
jgi:hypothetical protein